MGRGHDRHDLDYRYDHGHGSSGRALLLNFRKLTAKNTPPGEDAIEWVNLDKVLSIYVDKEHDGTCMSLVGDEGVIGPYVEAPEEIIKG
jgi:hypothetical protein